MLASNTCSMLRVIAPAAETAAMPRLRDWDGGHVASVVAGAQDWSNAADTGRKPRTHEAPAPPSTAFAWRQRRRRTTSPGPDEDEGRRHRMSGGRGDHLPFTRYLEHRDGHDVAAWWAMRAASEAGMVVPSPTGSR